MNGDNRAWNWEFAFEIFPEILSAITVTIGATVVAYFISLTIGLLFTLLRRSSFKPLSLLMAGIIEFIRATHRLFNCFLFSIQRRYLVFRLGHLF